MKRGYKYEKEMLHWLDGGKIEQRACGEEKWEPFDGEWVDCWQYRIAEKPEEEWWLYVNKVVVDDIYGGLVTLSTTATSETIGKIRMEDVWVSLQKQPLR